jgi:hypothetical protein
MVREGAWDPVTMAYGRPLTFVWKSASSTDRFVLAASDETSGAYQCATLPLLSQLVVSLSLFTHVISCR